MARTIRNRFQDYLRAIATPDPNVGLSVSDTLQPVSVVDHTVMVAPVQAPQFGIGPAITAVAGGRAILMMQCMKDTYLTGVTSNADDLRISTVEQSLGAIIVGLITTQSGSTVQPLGPDGAVGTESNVVTYGTTTLAGDDGFLLPVNGGMAFNRPILIKSGAYVKVNSDTQNRVASVGLSWLELQTPDIAAQEIPGDQV